MTPQELKNSILQLAIQGKLVEQRAAEGTGEELYQQIQKEKQRLIQEGTIKKEKPLPEISENELPFDIPKNWKWIRLGELINVIGGVSYKKGDVCKNGIRILRGGNIQSMKILLDEDDVFLPFDYQDSEKQIRVGDILIVASTGSKTVIGKAGYVDRKMPDTMIGAFLRICRPVYSQIVEYVRCLFDSDFYRKHIRDLSQGTNINNVKESYITEFVVPLPPLAEQKRIVAKIEELLPYIDRYEKARSKLEDFNKRFPVDMQKSILQMAIQGKLVEQRPEEGTGEDLYQQIQVEKQALIKSGAIKKEKLLPEITNSEIPFAVPESWKWVRLNDVSVMIGDIDHKMPPTVEKDGIPYVSPLNFTKEGGIDYAGAKKISREDYEALGRKCKPSKHDIIFPRYGTIGVVRIVETEEPFIVSYSCCTIKNFESTLMDYRYVFSVLRSRLIHDEINKYINKTTQPNVGLQSIKQFLFPLPPLAEQKRIVAKLEEILPLCERLK